MAPCRGFMHRRRDWERSLISRRAWCSGTVALLALIAALSATSPASAQYLFPAIPAPPPPNASASASSFQNAERNTRADSNGAGTNEDALAVVTIAGPRLREVPGRQQVKPASLSAATSAATATATAAAATVATDSSGLPRRSREELYIVYFRDVPSVVDYKGGIPGLAATAAPATDDGLTAAAAAAATAGTDDAGAVTATAATAGSDDIGATDDADDGDGMEAGYDADATGAAYATDGGTDAVGAARGSASVSASVAPAAAGGTRGASGARGIGRGRGRAAAAAAAVQAMRVLDGPRGRGRVDARDGNVRAFAQFLTGVQQHMLQTVGIPKGRIVHSYRYVLNAVSVRLTRLEARRVKRHVSVLKVERCQTVTVQTIHTPQFLQLPWRVWPSLGGRSKAGNGMIIGVVDTGIWPEHPSFSDKGYSPVPARWRGTCTTTSDFKSCSRKIIGARYFVEGLLASDGVLDPSVEYLSPRDASDHGTWCAGAAAGNPVKVSGGGTAQYGTASGMAPRARIAVYKAIWMQGKLAVGSDSDVFAAVDRAVADGVDVLSMSVAINEETYFKHLAMLRAARAGVFVSLVAGNSGPPPGSRAAYRTLTNLSPYYITVAASTSNQVWPPLAKLALGNRQSYAGQTLLGGDASTRRLPLVDAKTAAASGFTPSQAEACIPYSLSPSKVRGKIVVCCTGFSYASEKAVEVARAGGRALIIVPYSMGEGAIKATALGLPGLFPEFWKGKAIREYIRSTPNPIATLAPLYLARQIAPEMANFSGTGPAVNPAAGFFDSTKVTNAILKPDITAPGVSLLGPMAAGSTAEGSFRALSGTSMATPHVAGVALLIMQKYPSWSPAAVKSAILTTAYTTNTARGYIRTATRRVASPWNYGSGHIYPPKALDPGLVYDVGMMGYLSFLTGVDRAQTKAEFPQWTVAPIQPFNLNLPNICVPKLRRAVTVYRMVTNVSGKNSRYSAHVVAPANVAVWVSPASFVIGPSKSQTFSVTLRPKAATGVFSFGSLTWTDGVHLVRSVLAVQPIAV